MDLKKISLPYKFRFPLSPKSSQSWPRNYRKKTKEINSRKIKTKEKTREEKIRKKSLCQKSSQAATVRRREQALFRAPKGSPDHVHLGLKRAIAPHGINNVYVNFI